MGLRARSVLRGRCLGLLVLALLLLLCLSSVLRLLTKLAVARDGDVFAFGGEGEHDLAVYVETVVAGFEIEVLDDCTGMDVRSKPEMLYNGTACAP